ncbi:tripartite tricarboxylate transporter substrate binding protein [Diaphorobacter sp. HDW4A]|uniref:Bug family tripartite tricarboxylate transporter substrate binding protein n=1 Tax=Diaphorobacter sp. HDW4A TaxID=2714924 RepID=UPI0014074916|nr:tripartite tricarboxylate transporter substrate-binding protein [Diaphorobacter sp. HDW4A]QIL83098.1 tripartite tricarboxylate transporter substrate binding protein [Diaphorobacter sp. HDW4A]
MLNLKKAALAGAMAVGAALSGTSAMSADGAAYPTRPVSLVVPFAPGGGVDLMARYISKRLEGRLGQPVIVENKPGAGAAIGTGAVARAKADGQTLLFTSVAHAINPGFYPNLPFDAVKDFTPVGAVATAPNGIAARADAPFNTLPEMMAYAKANPDKLTYGAISGSTTMYLGMAMFVKEAGLPVRFIPYAGTPASVQAAVAGEIDMVSSGYASSDTFAKTGRLKMLAISTAKPSTMAPGIPTIAEAANLPGFEVVNWMGILAPAHTPAPIVERLNRELKVILDDPESEKFFELQKNERYYSTPEEFRKLITTDIQRYGKIIQETGAAKQK